MLATRHNVFAYGSAAPSLLVVGLNTSPLRFFLATKTVLFRTHRRAWWARASMTREITGMRASLRELSFTSTRLTA